MPIVTTYSGSITVTATEPFESSPFYETSKTLYGETLGELFDNVVEASIRLTRDTQNWVLANRDANYLLTDDFWKLEIALPDVYKTLKKQVPENIDSVFSTRFDEFKEIFTWAVCHRDSAIFLAVTHLQLTGLSHTSIPSESKVGLEKLYDFDTFEEMMACGWTGSELEEILEIARRENRITTLHAMDKYADRLSKYEKSQLDSSKGKNKEIKRKKWWHLS